LFQGDTLDQISRACALFWIHYLVRRASNLTRNEISGFWQKHFRVVFHIPKAFDWHHFRNYFFVNGGCWTYSRKWFERSSFQLCCFPRKYLQYFLKRFMRK
jgi:hypothetical protein